ncbi:MAG TPA: FHA domain-containing protein [Rubrobacteraceae bacterium]|nr:FHA domain-containing protein [Rubrobacteraceae bacterium]
MNVCPECGSPVNERMKFCAECGAKLAHGQSTVSYSPEFIEDEDTSGASAGGKAGAALIELDQVEGTAGRRMHDISEEVVTVGRSPSCNIFLDDVTVSRNHAEILQSTRGFRISDSGSLNGTYVNRVRVDSVDLRNGDEIQVGKYRFKFVNT